MRSLNRIINRAAHSLRSVLATGSLAGLLAASVMAADVEPAAPGKPAIEPRADALLKRLGPITCQFNGSAGLDLSIRDGSPARFPLRLTAETDRANALPGSLPIRLSSASARGSMAGLPGAAGLTSAAMTDAASSPANEPVAKTERNECAARLMIRFSPLDEFLRWSTVKSRLHRRVSEAKSLLCDTHALESSFA